MLHEQRCVLMYTLHQQDNSAMQRQLPITNPGGEVSESLVTPTGPSSEHQPSSRRQQRSAEESAKSDIKDLRDHLTLRLKGGVPTSREVNIHHEMKKVADQVNKLENQPKGTSQLTDKFGDLFAAEEMYLVHQCDCGGKDARGIADFFVRHVSRCRCLSGKSQ